MPGSTDELILSLARDAAPVRRLRPPLLRALAWLAAIGVPAAVAVGAFADFPMFFHRIQDPDLVIELIGTLGTGCLAVVAAFQLSVPGRSRLWAMLPLPTLAVWLAGSGMGCWRHFVAHAGGDWSLGESTDCFEFIVGLGVPLSLLLGFALRKARPIAPLPVMLLGTLGAAALAAFLLQFFHPFDVTFMDLAVHATAVLIVVAGATLWNMAGATLWNMAASTLWNTRRR